MPNSAQRMMRQEMPASVRQLQLGTMLLKMNGHTFLASHVKHT